LKQSGSEELPGAYAPRPRRPEQSEDTPRAKTKTYSVSPKTGNHFCSDTL